MAWLAWPRTGRSAAGATELVAGSLAHAEAQADARGLELDWSINAEDRAPRRTPRECGRTLQRARERARLRQRDRQLLSQGYVRCRICADVVYPSQIDEALNACDDCVREAMGWRNDPVDGWTYEGQP